MAIYLSDSYSIPTSGQVIPIPFNTPIIGYSSIFKPSQISKKQQASALIEPASVLWSPTTGNGSQDITLLNDVDWYYMTYVINNVDGLPFDYVGIAGHNMHPDLQSPTDNMETAFAISVLGSYDNVSWNTLSTYDDNPVEPRPIFITYNNVYTYNYILIICRLLQPVITNVRLRVGHIKVGMRSRLTHPVFVETTPLRMNDKYTYAQSQSELGHYLGRTIMQKGMEYSMKQERTLVPYYRENIEPFRQHVNGIKVLGNNGPVGTFFMNAQPVEQPNEIAYCHPGSFTAPNNYHNAGLVSYSFSGMCE